MGPSDLTGYRFGDTNPSKGHTADIFSTSGDGPMSRLTIGSGWKMNGASIADTVGYLRHLRESTIPDDIDLFILPPLTALHAAASEVGGQPRIAIGAQHAHWDSAPETTGEVSMAMIRDAGATIVEMGHSERRALFGETDELVHRRLRAALDTGLRPLVCVGENADQRSSGRAREIVERQARAALHNVDGSQLADVIVAYEPVWSIGENGRPARPEEVSDICLGLVGLGVGQVLYGGGVSVENIVGFIELAGVDGVFAGRSTWAVTGLLRLIEQVTSSREAAACPPS